jgi:poly-gamma-glutamate synthesis protein (capsule biosynthesis protein)
MDFGRPGLLETLDVLAAAGLQVAGAGRSFEAAAAPAIVPLNRIGGRLVIFAFGTPSSGIPLGWAATEDSPGVNVVRSLTDAVADQLCRAAEDVRMAGDLIMVSVHWGSNWGYEVDADQVRFAHRLIDGGVDLVHGHSSHHPRPIEVYRNKLILYGCGDLVDDYEGIRGYERYRDDLRLLYLVDLEPTGGRLVALRMVPLQARKMRLEHASAADAEWLRTVLDEISRDFGCRIERGPQDLLQLRPTR